MKIGIDIVKVSRFSKIVKDEAFLKKNFAKSELGYFKDKKERLQTLAGLYASKEAFLKALGIGVLNGVKLSQVVIHHKEFGQPEIIVDEKILKAFDIKKIDVSITHDGGFTVAVCIVE